MKWNRAIFRCITPFFWQIIPIMTGQGSTGRVIAPLASLFRPPALGNSSKGGAHGACDVRSCRGKTAEHWRFMAMNPSLQYRPLAAAKQITHTALHLQHSKQAQPG